MGLFTAVDGSTRVIAPVLGGYVLGIIGTLRPVLSAILASYLIFFGWMRLDLSKLAVVLNYEHIPHEE